MSVLLSFLLTLRSSARSRVALQLEILALQHQLQVLQRAPALVIVQPETVIAFARVDRMASCFINLRPIPDKP
jgi:hypothetical protein